MSVSTLVKALDAKSYDPYIAPTDKKVETAVIAKKKRDSPEKIIFWQNQETSTSTAGRPPAVKEQEGNSWGYS